MGTPRITRFTLGPFQTNCYVVREDAAAPACWVVDCGMEPAPLLAFLETERLEPEVVVLTHAHADHIGGLHDLRAKFPGCPIWIHRDEELWLTDAERNLSALGGHPMTAPPPDRLLDHAEVLELGGRSWEVRHTPGHSPGSISLVEVEPAGPAPVVFAGDALFAGSIGRTDFPGSSFEQLERAIRRQLYTLSPETVVLPGHGPPTTIGEERLSNPFVRGTADATGD